MHSKNALILWDFEFLRGPAPVRSDEFSSGSYEENRKSFGLNAAMFGSGAMRFSGEKSLGRWNSLKTVFPSLSFYYK